MDSIVNKTFQFHANITEKQVSSEGKRRIRGYASTKTQDRVGHIVEPEAFRGSIDRFIKNNPVLLWRHSSDRPIGKVVSASIEENGLFVEAEIITGEEWADKVWKWIQEGVIRAFSIGFIVKGTKEINVEGEKILVITDLDLLEISVVPIPANQETLFSIAKAIELGGSDLIEIKDKDIKDDIDIDVETKAVVPFQDLPTAPIDTPWSFTAADGNKILGDPPDWKRYKKAHVWWDPSKPEVKASYKLPIAKMFGNTLKAVWRGVAAAMAALLGARGGVDIPAQDRRGVYNHLVKYYKKFDKEPPEFKENGEVIFKSGELEILESMFFGDKEVLEAEIRENIEREYKEKIEELKAELEELKEGRVLSRANRERIQKTINYMNECVTMLSELLEMTDNDKKEEEEVEEEARLDELKELISTLQKNVIEEIEYTKKVNEKLFL